ncbi:PHB depolymerase family esterase [Umezawaea sp.]|uniref:alpha/beta hydrolase family esterase n=1 Tax=Umezawaea sp. TaxID=1955258 RepID=UPI002ED49C28
MVEGEAVEVDGRRRTLTVVRPEVVAEGAAVVLVLHGSNQDGRIVRRFAGYGFDAFAERGGAVVAYLDGHRGNWNEARARSDFAARREGFDDVAFAGAVVDLLVSEHRVDPARVHAVGYSAGGSMVIRLAHEIGPRLAGIGLVAATLPVPGELLPFDGPVVPLPVVLFHGTRDRLVPYDGGVTSLWGFRPRGLGLSARETAAYFAGRNGITAAPESHDLGSSAGDRTAVERTDHRQDGRPTVTLYTVHGGGHVVPGPGRPLFVMGRPTRGLVAARALGEAFGLPA